MAAHQMAEKSLPLPSGRSSAPKWKEQWNPIEARNLLLALQAEEHPQYQAYMKTLTIAKNCGVSWLPIGLVQHDAFKFHGVLEKIHQKVIPDRLQWVSGQMGLTEVSLRRSNHLSSTERLVAACFMKVRNRHSLGVGEVHSKRSFDVQHCQNCRKSLLMGEYYVTVMEKHSRQSVWCLKCFHCDTCQQVLVDFIYFWHHNSIYCLRHYGEQIRPRCYTCDELIFNKEFTKAGDRSYHLEHFLCYHCETCLTDQKYISRNEVVYCVSCYDLLFCNTCVRCNKVISSGTRSLCFKEYHWHEGCFICSICRSSLVNRAFRMRNGRDACCVYCIDATKYNTSDSPTLKTSPTSSQPPPPIGYPHSSSMFKEEVGFCGEKGRKDDLFVNFENSRIPSKYLSELGQGKHCSKSKTDVNSNVCYKPDAESEKSPLISFETTGKPRCLDQQLKFAPPTTDGFLTNQVRSFTTARHSLQNSAFSTPKCPSPDESPSRLRPFSERRHIGCLKKASQEEQVVNADSQWITSPSKTDRNNDPRAAMGHCIPWIMDNSPTKSQQSTSCRNRSTDFHISMQNMLSRPQINVSSSVNPPSVEGTHSHQLNECNTTHKSISFTHNQVSDTLFPSSNYQHPPTENSFQQSSGFPKKVSANESISPPKFHQMPASVPNSKPCGAKSQQPASLINMPPRNHTLANIATDETVLPAKSLQTKNPSQNLSSTDCYQQSSVSISSSQNPIHVNQCSDSNKTVASSDERCLVCHELFDEGEKTLEYKGMRWHEECFKCYRCHAMIGVDTFFPVSSDKVLCLICFAAAPQSYMDALTENAESANDPSPPQQNPSQNFNEPLREDPGKTVRRCHRCSQPISNECGGNDVEFITLTDQHYHLPCFTCLMCKSNLNETGFVKRSDGVTCQKCHDFLQLCKTSENDSPMSQFLPKQQLAPASTDQYGEVNAQPSSRSSRQRRYLQLKTTKFSIPNENEKKQELI